MNLFQLGDFVLSSGVESRWKLECDALTEVDWTALAAMVRQMVGRFGKVIGVPTGGLKLAAALKPFEMIAGPTLIVDDVLTTGASMEKMRDMSLEGPTHVGVVVFARGQCPYWVKPLFQMPECFWLKPRTRGG
jgi:orotate phosphoribosyltransferase